jgi:predicted nuclease of predicted toxin-antitoxin system
MKLFFDQNLSFKLCKLLEDLFPNSTQARLVDLAKAEDDELWQYAKEGKFVIVSLDSDFAELAGLNGPPPKVLWLRCGNQPTAVIESLLRDHVSLIRAFVEDEQAACLEIY